MGVFAVKYCDALWEILMSFLLIFWSKFGVNKAEMWEIAFIISASSKCVKMSAQPHPGSDKSCSWKEWKVSVKVKFSLLCN